MLTSNWCAWRVLSLSCVLPALFTSSVQTERLLAVPLPDPVVPDYRYDASTGILGDPSNVVGWNSDAPNTAEFATDRTWTGFSGVTQTPISHRTMTHALSFTGAGSGTTASFGGTFDQSASFEFWFRPASLGSDMVLWESGGGTHGAAMRLNPDGTLTFLTRNDNSNQTNATTVNAITDTEQFYQVVGVVDPANSETRIYLDGLLEDTRNSVRNWHSGTNDAGLGDISSTNNGGAGVGSAAFGGDFGLVRFFDTALDDLQVEELYLQVNPPLPPPLTPEPGTIALFGAALCIGLVFRQQLSS